MHNKRLLIAILFFILAGIALVAGFTRLELSPESPQVIIGSVYRDV